MPQSLFSCSTGTRPWMRPGPHLTRLSPDPVGGASQRLPSSDTQAGMRGPERPADSQGHTALYWAILASELRASRGKRSVPGLQRPPVPFLTIPGAQAVPGMRPGVPPSCGHLCPLQATLHLSGRNRDLGHARHEPSHQRWTHRWLTGAAQGPITSQPR